MTLILRCSRCGYVLDSYDPKPNDQGMQTIFIPECPRCGYKFKYKIARVVVRRKQKT